MKREYIIWLALIMGACSSNGEDKSAVEDDGTDSETQFDDSEKKTDSTDISTEESGTHSTQSDATGDSAQETTDVETTQDSETENDTVDNITYYCPEGTTSHNTSSGRLVCCSDSNPIFCDETSDDDYSGGCWPDGVGCDTITFCGDTWTACLEDSVPFCGEDGDLVCYPCGEDTVKHETTSGRTICCSADRPTFCNENDLGYTGGCWSDGVDCDTITECGGSYRACSQGTIPYCGEDDDFSCISCADDSTRYETQSGRPVCCSAEKPIFCDENQNGYSGGCWAEGIDCSTVIPCGDGVWGACMQGTESSCEDGEFACN